MPFTSCSRWPDVHLAAAARAVSSCGDFLAAIALVLALQQRGAGSVAVAAVLLASAAPPVLLARWTGRLADRVDSRLLLVATGLAQASVCAVLAFASGAAEIVALAAVLAAGLAVTGPCLSALLPAMVAADDLPRATALTQTAASMGTLLAPVLGGALMGAYGLRVPLLVDAASYLAIAGAGGLIRTRRGGRADRLDRAAAAPDGGWRLRDDGLLWSAVVLLGAVVAAASLVNVAEVFLVRGVLHSTASVYGLLGSVWTGGTMAGGWLIARQKPADAGLAATLLVTLAVTCLGVAGMAAVPSALWLAPVEVIGGLGNGGVNVSAAVLLGRRAPAAVRGRVFAVCGAVANAATMLGYCLGGLLLTVASVRATIASAGLLGIAVTAGLALPVLRAAARERAAASAAADGAAVPAVPE